jgi:hypothetical protein
LCVRVCARLWVLLYVWLDAERAQLNAGGAGSGSPRVRQGACGPPVRDRGGVSSVCPILLCPLRLRVRTRTWTLTWGRARSASTAPLPTWRPVLSSCGSSLSPPFVSLVPWSGTTAGATATWPCSGRRSWRWLRGRLPTRATARRTRTAGAFARARAPAAGVGLRVVRLPEHAAEGGGLSSLAVEPRATAALGLGKAWESSLRLLSQGCVGGGGWGRGRGGGGGVVPGSCTTFPLHVIVGRLPRSPPPLSSRTHRDFSVP